MRITESRLRRIIRSVILENTHHVDTVVKDMLEHRKDFKDQYGFWNKAACIDVQKFGKELGKLFEDKMDQGTAIKCKNMNWLAPSIQNKVKEAIGGKQDDIFALDAYGGERTGEIQGTDKHVEKAIEICIELYKDTLSGGSMVREMFGAKPYRDSDSDIDSEPEYDSPFGKNIMRP
jgi:hypothetical protein